jgi:integrase
MTSLINIERRGHRPNTRYSDPSAHVEDKRVSEWARFVDPVWILSLRHTIHWSRLPEYEGDVDRDAFDSLMIPVKRVAFLLLTEEEQSPATVYNSVQAMKMFACWILSETIPIRRFADVTTTMITRYLDEVRLRSAGVRVRVARKNSSAHVSIKTVRVHVQSMLRLYQYRDRIGDGLQDVQVLLDQPLPRQQEPFESKTEPIPDEEFQILLSGAVSFVNENAVSAIHGLREFLAKEKVIEIHEALSKFRRDDLSPRRLTKVAAQIREALRPWRGAKPWDRAPAISPYTLALETKRSVGECVHVLLQNHSLRAVYQQRRKDRRCSVNWVCTDESTKIRLLQTACFIIIAASTGMRLGELLAIRPGCLVKRKVRGTTLYWIKSILKKTSSSQVGEAATWLCGELAGNAIEILEQLHAVLPTTTRSKWRSNVSRPDSLFRTYVWDALTLEARPLTSTKVLQRTIDLFIQTSNLRVGGIHPHRFRRSFARNIVRWTETPILALQRHFKHWSLLMTDYYIGVDVDLMEKFFDEQQEASKGRLRQILSGECGGPGGLILQKRLTKMIDFGELPKSFRGRKRETSIEAMIDEMSRDGVLAYKCGEFTTCLYVPGVAKCGEDGPKEHECHPTGCANSYILIEDVPFFLKNITHNIRVYQQLSLADQGGPFGLFVRKRICNDITAIKPLAEIYKQKLRGLQAQYEALNEVETKTGSAVELRDRITQESKTLDVVLTDDWRF